MNCVVSRANLKVLARALQALSKIGDELYIESKRELLSLVTLNSSKTVCARFHFSDSFFTSYSVDDKELSPENKETLTCKVHLKVILPLFKNNLEKKLDYLKIEFETNKDFIILKMKYKIDDILMTHKLRLMENETLSIGISTDSSPNHLSASSGFYNQILGMFNVSDDEITLEIAPSKVIARNYCIGAPCRPRMMRTQVNLNSTEFTSYRVATETSVNFSLKPLRTLIHFADGFGLNIDFNFDTGGKPLSMAMKNPTFDVNYIVATLNPASDANSSMTSAALVNETKDRTKSDGNVEQSESVKSFSELVEQGRNRSCDDDTEQVPKSPESPRSKRLKVVFGRCFDNTFHDTMLGGRVLAANSDSD